MAFEPRFTITPEILMRLERIQSLHLRIESSAVRLGHLPLVQKEALAKSAHGSTAIEGNPLTQKEVNTVLEGKPLPSASSRSIHEIRNTAQVLRFIQERSDQKRISVKDVFHIHSLLGRAQALDRGPFGAWRHYGVQVGGHIAPHWQEVAHYMKQLLEWVNREGARWPAVVSSAVVHQRFEWIHPFGDGNGRVGRALALWELYRRKFDTHHLFAVDETIWEHRKRYYAELARAETGVDPDLTLWIEFIADMIEKTLEKTWKRLMDLASTKPERPLPLSPGQERLLGLLRHGPKRMSALVSELELTRAGVHYLLKPLMQAGLIRRSGTHKSGLYHLGTME